MKRQENENQNVEEEEQQDIFDDRLDDLDMNILDDDQTPTPVDATNTMCSSSQLTQSGNLQDDGQVFLLECHSRTRMNYLTLCLFLA